MTSRKLDAVLTGRPVDQTAARVTQPGPAGLTSSRSIPGDTILAAAPPLTRAVPADVPDLTGTITGHLRVVGLWRSQCGHRGSANRNRWVCRCVCGYYVIRTRKALRNPINQRDACDRCLHVRHLKRAHHWRTTGEQLEN